MKTRQEIPCQVCGQPRTFHVGMQWCSSCGWNRQAALSGLRMRSRIMTGTAAFILIAEAFLLWSIPPAGLIYLPLAVLVTVAVVIIPYREYRNLQLTAGQTSNSSSPEAVIAGIQKLQPRPRISALFLLVLASATDIGLFLAPGSLAARIPPAVMMLFLIVFFYRQFLREQRIVASYVPTFAKIVRFEKGRRQRVAIYEYKSSFEVPMTGRGSSLKEFSAGMAVPILYNSAKPAESLPVPDFLFYKIQARLP